MRLRAQIARAVVAYSIGLLHYQAGLLNDAGEWMDAGLRLDPTSRNLLFNYGVVLERQGACAPP